MLVASTTQNRVKEINSTKRKRCVPSHVLNVDKRIDSLLRALNMSKNDYVWQKVCADVKKLGDV